MESKKRTWSERNIGGRESKRSKLSEEGACEETGDLSKENLEILDKVAGNNRISVELWLRLGL